jgi:hypothetical protein
MRDELSIGPTPSGETCEQLGPHYDATKARRECSAFVEQLRRVFGPEPEGARFRITSNPHDFGSYYDVVVVFDDENPEAVAYAFKVEGATPESWDAGAVDRLTRSQG